MPSGTDTDLATVESIREILAAMPRAQMARPGHPLEWGPEGNKARAIYLAATLGHSFDPNCTSCDFDLYMVLKNAAR